MYDRDEEYRELEVMYELLVRKIYEMSEKNISRLLTELDTGGNIRFEEGRM